MVNPTITITVEEHERLKHCEAFHLNVASWGKGRTRVDLFTRMLIIAMENHELFASVFNKNSDDIYIIYNTLKCVEEEEIRQFKKSE